MLNIIILQAGDHGAAETIIMYVIVGYVILFIHLYIFRAVFNIPSFMRYQRAQIRLLEQLAKAQGIDEKKVQEIVTESYGWDGAPGAAEPQWKK